GNYYLIEKQRTFYQAFELWFSYSQKLLVPFVRVACIGKATHVSKQYISFYHDECQPLGADNVYQKFDSQRLTSALYRIIFHIIPSIRGRPHETL
ncbi:MAG TPA: hypothetical protein VII24_08175, partial [Pseudolabrys sp.]